MDHAKRDRLQKRLLRRFPGDRGEVPDALHDALSFSGAQSDRLEQVAAALSECRILVGVFPGYDDTELHLTTIEGVRAIDAFSGAEAMRQADPKLRPVPMSAREVAMTAVGLGVNRISIDRDILLPPAVIIPLAAGDPWVPPWKDQLLLDQLNAASARETVPGFQVTNVSVRDQLDPIVVDLVVGSALPPKETRMLLQRLIASMAEVPRLRALDERIEFVPRLLPVV